MKSLLTEKEITCNIYRERFKNNWEFYCLTGDAYSAGYEQARLDAINEVQLSHRVGNLSLILYYLMHMKSNRVEVEYKDGSHQIGVKSTDD